MNIKDKVGNVDHIAIPTNSIDETMSFYKELGFEVILRTYNETAKEEVAFLKLHNYVIETFENGQAALMDGAYQHVAIEAVDVEKLFVELKEAGYIMLHDEVQYLPFWDNGTKFFMIQGPNKERIEFCQKL